MVEVEDYDLVMSKLVEFFFDFVLFDWMLFGGSGINFIKYMKCEEMMCNIFVVMFIVCGEEEDKVCGLEVGVDDYIIKLFLFKELVVCLKVVICCVILMVLEDVIDV